MVHCPSHPLVNMETWTSPRQVLVLLGLLGSLEGLLVPRISFITGDPGRSLTHFTSPGIENSTTLLLSDDGATLYVGAKDVVLSLDVSQPGIIEMRSKVDWSPETKELSDCTLKGKSEADCRNFVRVLQFLNTSHIYACGTFAFNPTCAFINIETFTLLGTPNGKREDGKGRCPFNPYERSTAIAVEGELYTGTVANFRGNQPVISRFLSKRSRGDLKLDDVQGWLTEPTFVSSTFIPSEGKVYYFFRETGMEYTFINDFTVSRVAQVCTSDVGGKLILQKRWTTFAKAQLRCQAGTDLPFNIIQDIVTLQPPEGDPPDDTLFYGVFSSQWSVTSGQSAVCAFRLGDIKKVFAGNYMTLNRGTLRFDSPHTEKVASPGQCGLHSASDTKQRFVRDNFLAEDSVVPEHPGLTLVSRDQLYIRVVAQRTRAANGNDFTVLFLLTESGFLHKTVLSDKDPHIIEEIQVFKQPQSVKNILLSITKGVLFIGSSEGVFQVPVSNCSYYSTCAECVLARDPFCGWDSNRLACAEVASISSGVVQDVESGNVEKACHASQMGTSESAEKSEYVLLNDVVSLHCPQASRLALLRWELPDSTFHPNTFLQHENGALSFIATPNTLGTYRCIAVENGYEQTLASISVKQRSINHHHSPTQTPPKTAIQPNLEQEREEVTKGWAKTRRKEVTKEWAKTRKEEVTKRWAKTRKEEVTKGWVEIQTPPASAATTAQNELAKITETELATPIPLNEICSTWREGKESILFQDSVAPDSGRSFDGELLAVSLLLVVSLCLLTASVVYIHCQKKSVATAIQGYAGAEEEVVCPNVMG
ncbi:hypothetical protein GJAV_G00008280 [Gymnothorax javanicus]|nr:hypothetical protein GJAV_G00008280 [Gymnothorax javanicus]